MTLAVLADLLAQLADAGDLAEELRMILRRDRERARAAGVHRLETLEAAHVLRVGVDATIEAHAVVEAARRGGRR